MDHRHCITESSPALHSRPISESKAQHSMWHVRGIAGLQAHAALTVRLRYLHKQPARTQVQNGERKVALPQAST
jgi:hypothetical protein